MKSINNSHLQSNNSNVFIRKIFQISIFCKQNLVKCHSYDSILFCRIFWNWTLALVFNSTLLIPTLLHGFTSQWWLYAQYSFRVLNATLYWNCVYMIVFVAFLRYIHRSPCFEIYVHLCCGTDKWNTHSIYIHIYLDVCAYACVSVCMCVRERVSKTVCVLALLILRKRYMRYMRLFTVLSDIYYGIVVKITETNSAQLPSENCIFSVYKRLDYYCSSFFLIVYHW